MRKFILFALLGMVIGAANVSADSVCGTNQGLQPIGDKIWGPGTTALDAQIITTGAAAVRMVIVTCETTACIAALYDADDVAGDITAANAHLEVGAAASTIGSLPPGGMVLDPPIVFPNGIAFVDDGNVAGLGVYGCADN